MQKVLLSVITVFSMCTITSLCCAQSLIWLQGQWQGRAYFANSDATQHYNLTLTISSINGNKFEGVISTIQPSDTSVRFDSKISGIVYESYLVIKRVKILYVRNPTGAEWKLSCNNCSPPHMVFSIERGKFFFRGQQDDCYKECNGISEFSKDTTEFDLSQKEAAYALLNGKQKNKLEETLVRNTNAPSKDSITTNSSDNTFAMQRIALIPAGSIIKTKYNISSLSGKVTLPLYKFLSIITQENTSHTQKIIASLNDTVSTIKRNVALQLSQKASTHLQRKTSLQIIQEESPATTRIPVLPVDIVLMKHKNNLLPRRRSLIRTTSLAIQQSVPIAATKIPSTIDTISLNKNISALQPPALRRDTVAALPVDYSERKKNVVRTIVVNTDSIVLRVYDNGVVDGDIVSVVYNDKVVIDKLSLTGRAVVVKIPVTAIGINTLVFHAHNLGEFPPNTAKLEILYGNKKEELTVSSDLTVSSTINVVYHE